MQTATNPLSVEAKPPPRVKPVILQVSQDSITATKPKNETDKRKILHNHSKHQVNLARKNNTCFQTDVTSNPSEKIGLEVFETIELATLSKEPPPLPSNSSFYENLARKTQRYEIEATQARQAWENIKFVCESDAASIKDKIEMLERFIQDFCKNNKSLYEKAKYMLERIAPCKLEVEKRFATINNIEIPFHYHKVTTKFGKTVLDIGTFSVIPPGKLKMGGHRSDTKPEHLVDIGYSFEVMQTTITQRLWKAVMSYTPLYNNNYGTYPIRNVNWYGSIAFCNALSRKAGLSPYYIISDEKHRPWEEFYESNVTHNPEGRDGYRLLSEAEWEYTCRAGTTGPSYGELDKIATFYGNSRNYHDHSSVTRIPSQVATKYPNNFGMYDMLGNVWEWVEDGYCNNYFTAPNDGSVSLNPDSSGRVLRGGSYKEEHPLVFIRKQMSPDKSDVDIGFRCSRNVN